MDNQTASSRFTQLEENRTSFLDRARDAAVLTIPTLMPPSGAGPQTKYSTPFQGMGARGVNNLASKLLTALLPSNTPFFRFLVDDFILEKITQQEGMRGEVDLALNKMERAVQTEIEAIAIRVTAFEAFKQLISSGNVLCYLPPTGGMRAFRLDRYVVQRDPMGNILEIITREEVSPTMLPNITQMMIKANEDGTSPTKTVKLYTWVRREEDKWTIHQEIDNGAKIPNSDGTYPLDKSPWMALRWSKIDGEDYGRGHVEEYMGDLRSLEALSQAIVEGSAAAAKMLFLVNPNGSTKIETIAKAPSGAVRAGVATDVSVLHLDKQADFQVALSTIERIEQRLSAAFLLVSSVTRQAERVTAEEIRLMAGELEDALGGVYSVMSQEFQLPLVNRLIFSMEKKGRLPRLPAGMIKPTITTGLDALGRGNDGAKLERFLARLDPLGPDVVAQYLNVAEYIKRLGVSDGIDMAGLINSDEDIQKQQQQAQMMQMLQKLGPNAINQAGGMARDQMDPANALPPQGQGGPPGASVPDAAAGGPAY